MGVWRRLQRGIQGKRGSASRREVSIDKIRLRASPLEIGQGSDIGKVRQSNEDAFFTLNSVISIDPDPLYVGLLVVADGMGGHAKGKDASSIAIRAANGVVMREVLLPLLAGQGAGTIGRPIQEILTEATAAANEAVSGIDEEAGTTLTSVLVVGHSAHVAHVGDTRVYHLDNGEMRQITQDHSLVSRLVELGQISAQEAPEHPQRNFLYRAVGQGPELKVDTYFQRLAEGSHLVLCSDGLWNQVTEREIVEVIDNSSSPQEACDRLIDRANEKGGEDNITLLLAKVNY